MPSVEERLAKLEREIELLREHQRKWPIAQLGAALAGDATLAEIFRMVNEDCQFDKHEKPE